MANKKILLLIFALLPFSVNAANVTYTNPQVSLIRNTGANIDVAVTDSHYFRKHATVASLLCQHLGQTYVSYVSGYPTGSSVPQTQNFGTVSDLWSSGGSTSSVITSLTCASAGVPGCTDPNADNYNFNATQDDNSCYIAGCTDPNADNYNFNATQDDNSCYRNGCTNASASNYDPLATQDNGTCYIDNFYGCTNASATNYNPNATIDDNSCYIAGCTDTDATNYNPLATIENNSCLYSGSGSFIITNEISPVIDGGFGEDVFSKQDIVDILYFEFIVLFILTILVYIDKIVYGRTKKPSKYI